MSPPNKRLHLTPQVGMVAEWTGGTVQGTGLVFQVPFWVLVPGFQKQKYVCGAGEPRPLGGAVKPQQPSRRDDETVLHNNSGKLLFAWVCL